MIDDFIIKGNRLIAEFLKWEKWDKLAYVLPKFWCEDFIICHNYNALEPEEMLFHKSYDWLKPVVDKVCKKIESLLDNKSIADTQEEDLMKFYEYFDNINMFDLKIKQLYSQVVSFINWNNNNEIPI